VALQFRKDGASARSASGKFSLVSSGNDRRKIDDGDFYVEGGGVMHGGVERI
jgi:hypothetical protein